MYYHLSKFAQGVTKPAGINRHCEYDDNGNVVKYTPMNISKFNDTKNHVTDARKLDNNGNPRLIGSKEVKKGALIGYTGNTGHSISSWGDPVGTEAGFHLHFAITKANGSALAGGKTSFYKPWFKFIN